MGNLPTTAKKKGDRSKGKVKDELKLVVLGIAACGKSTFVRQMRLIHQCPWTQQELENYYQIICYNIWDGLKEVCVHMKKHNIDCESKDNRKRLRYFRELPQEKPPLDATEVERMKTLWTDKGVEKCVEIMASQDLAVHNLKYFMDRLDKIVATDYVPSDEDILFARQRSTGATETSFIVRWTLIDMGGQRPERAKWERAMAEGIRGVFFFVSTEEFDVDSTEEIGKTKFEIALATWKDLLTTPHISHLAIYVLLNKKDLLEKKLTADFSSFTTKFPSYSGEKTLDGVLGFLKQLFLDGVPATIQTESISVVNCCALDTKVVENLFSEAKTHLLTKGSDDSK